MPAPALILHGGAGARRSRDYAAEIAHMREVVEIMRGRLESGTPALDRTARMKFPLSLRPVARDAVACCWRPGCVLDVDLHAWWRARSCDAISPPTD